MSLTTLSELTFLNKAVLSQDTVNLFKIASKLEYAALTGKKKNKQEIVAIPEETRYVLTGRKVLAASMLMPTRKNILTLFESDASYKYLWEELKIETTTAEETRYLEIPSSADASPSNGLHVQKDEINPIDVFVQRTLENEMSLDDTLIDEFLEEVLINASRLPPLPKKAKSKKLPSKNGKVENKIGILKLYLSIAASVYSSESKSNPEIDKLFTICGYETAEKFKKRLDLMNGFDVKIYFPYNIAFPSAIGKEKNVLTGETYFGRNLITNKSFIEHEEQDFSISPRVKVK